MGKTSKQRISKKVSDTDVIKKIAYEVSVSKMEKVSSEFLEENNDIEINGVNEVNSEKEVM